ncbi:MAG TPA: PQQ-dependent sugar dehydrogenase [Thermoanaerobaculia bacterium]
MRRNSKFSARFFARFSVIALLLLTAPRRPARAADPAPATGPFTVAGNLAGVSLQQVATDLGSVTGITNAGDGRLFLTLREGRIVILENGAVRQQPFLDIHDKTTTDGERGLLSTAFHPHYAGNGFLFVNYTNIQGNTVIARYQVSAADPNQADPASARILLTIEQPYSNHNGGQLQFGPDGDLYIGMGDGGSGYDPECRAQNPSMLLGKMLRIDVDQNVATPPYYGIPASNPFRGPGDPPDEVWASGLRNPWRFSFDRETGDLWIGDVGQDQHEEIDFQPASSRGGENYGWKVMEGTYCSSRDACPASTPPCGSPAYTLPVLEYSHQSSRCAVTGGYVYRGHAVTQLQGDYVFGDLCAGTIWAAARSGDGFTVRMVSGQVSQLTTFGEDHDGELYAANLTGQLFRFVGQAVGGTAETVGLYDPQTSRFQLKSANSAGAGVQVIHFGPRRNGWLPIAGDWNGDGKTTFGFYDPAAATFRLKNSLSGGVSDVLLQVDAPSSRVLPVVGDWDGDGKDTVGLYDPATRTFRLKSSLSGSGFDVTFAFGPGTVGLIPVAGDWNGDGKDSVGLFDPAAAVFYLTNGFQDAPPDFVIQFGPPGRGAFPVIGDWNGDGHDDLGVYDPVAAVFRLRNSLSPGSPDAQFRFGTRRQGWQPIAGHW